MKSLTIYLIIEIISLFFMSKAENRKVRINY